MPTRPPGTPDVDLTYDGASGTINGGVFQTAGVQPAGTGNFNTFVRIQNTGTEQGYNTDAAAQFDEKASFHHSVLLANIPVVIGDGTGGTEEGVAYREFRLDLNEGSSGTNPFLSLDALQIFQEEAGNLTNFTPGSGFAGGHTNYLVYDMDAGGDHWVGLNDALSHGSGQSDIRILIPDSAFINDAGHRYVTLYSQFGVQSGWNSEGGYEEWSLNNDHTGPTDAIAVHKTASVPGGTANVAGEVISYSINVDNVGDTTLTGITVTDPSVTNLTYVSGDTDSDGNLDAGETWHYTASYTVTQNDLNTNGDGRGAILNTVTADSAQTAPVSASTSVDVESGAGLEMTKTASVMSVDSAGDVISYTLLVTNTGTTQLSGLHVDDTNVNILIAPVTDPDAPILGPELLAPVLVGDYNIGDVGTLAHPEFAQNGVEDPGETFVFVNAGDNNQNGIIEPGLGEVALYTNVGDTNQNGFQDGAEVFQYYNVGDTNHNGVEDDGETFQFTFDHSATPVLVGGFNAGDTNQNGLLDPSEIWQYTVSYTVTQADIDNGGVVDPSLTHDNTATADTDQDIVATATASVDIVQNPHVTLTKSATVADGTADAAGDVINYAISVHNDGNMTLTGADVSDPPISDLTRIADAVGGNNDNILDVGETWRYTANHTVTQADIDNGGVVNAALAYSNTASVTTDQGTQDPNGDPDANDTGSASVHIVQNPHLTVAKTATVPGGTADTAGEVISYAITVHNDGNMTLTGAAVSDPSVSGLMRVADLIGNNDNILNLGETWQYTASHTVTQADLDSHPPTMSGPGTIDNTASATTSQGASGSASAHVPVAYNPAVDLTKAASVPGGTADTAGEVISYTINVANTGNITLTGVNVTDPSEPDFAAVMTGAFNSGDTNQDGNLSVGETWHYTASHTVTTTDLSSNGGGDGTIDNTASVTTTQGASDSASTHVTVVPPPPPTFTMTLEKTAFGFIDNNNNDVADTGDTLVYHFTVHNTGTGTLTEINVSDPDGTVTMSGSQLASLAAGATDSTNWSATYTINSTDTGLGYHDNEAVANSLETNAVSGTIHTILASLNELPI